MIHNTLSKHSFVSTCRFNEIVFILLFADGIIYGFFLLFFMMVLILLLLVSVGMSYPTSIN